MPKPSFPSTLAESRMRPTASIFRRLAVVWGILGTILLATGVLVAGALVTDDVRTDTPIALDGEVWDIEQVGNFVVVAGNFTRVQTERNGPIVNQAGLYAYDIDSGKFHHGFRPTLGLANPEKLAEVKTLEAAADGRSVYFGGRFTTVNDGTDGKVRTRNRIAMIDVTNGRLDRNFAKGGVDAKVLTMELVDGHIYVGGNYSKVYSFDIGRPPTEVAQHSLARFDAGTGALDTSFTFLPETSIAVTGMLGVTNIDTTPNGRWMVFTHRGENIVDTRRGQTHVRPGVAMLDLAAGDGPAMTGFQALFPDPNDPDQNMYHRNSCAGRGVFIRDMEISPDGSYFVLVHQGHDSGYNCDTAVRYPIATTAVRPDWVSRLFDSVFSVGIDEDAIYVGGHFRYMIHPNAPTAYPGRTAPNATGPNCVYCVADFEATAFRSEMIDTGYVYRAYQMGAIDPSTGKGIPSWNPGSDAYKCVCAITVIDRGLLIGQDRGRVDGYNVGRSGFFDNTPDVGDPRCSVIVNANRDPVVSWVDIGDVSEWRVARNGDFIGSTNDASLSDDDAPIETDLTYELRYNRNGLSHTDDCGTVRVNQITLDCIATLEGENTVWVDWNNVDVDRYTIRRDGVWEANEAERTRWQDTDLQLGTTYSYEVSSIRNGTVSQTTTCSVTTAGRQAACAATVDGTMIIVNFNGTDFNRVRVSRNGDWQATVDGTNTWSQTVEPGTYRYEVTGTVDGFRSTVTCGDEITIGAAALTCTAAVDGDLATLTINGEDFDRISIERDGLWQTTVSGDPTWTQTLEPGVYAYTATGIDNGFRSGADCGSVTVGAPALVCSTTVDDDVITVSFNGSDFDRISIERDGAWLATLTEGETSFNESLPTGTYTYVARGVVNGQAATGDCGTPEVAAPVLLCTVAVVGGDVLLSWNDVGSAEYQIRTNGGWTTTLGAGTTSWTVTGAAGLGDTYAIRYRLDGAQTTTGCA